MSAEQAARRERVTGEPRTARPLPRHRAQSEIDEQTALGEAYVRSLMRGQLRAALTGFAVLALTVATLPPAFRALDDPAVTWCVLGFAVYGPLGLIAWWYVRTAERNERDFARLVADRPTEGRPPHGGPTRARAPEPGSPNTRPDHGSRAS
ncbi:hypothetical protein N4G70_15765 [Streptomyces sp. ASQP_92]|nr:hypothetical protein [Streptomyces sp. ASQP_92]MCT9090310.1 hypothetical protein [Streptomyces sp. ASQP_92]